MIAPSETIMPGERPMIAVARPARQRETKEIEMKSVTVAGIDCGTNSIRLKIARVDDQGMHEIVPRILRVIRLGQDVDKTHRCHGLKKSVVQTVTIRLTFISQKITTMY